MQSNIWIVIVNYRTADLVIDCLRALASQISDVANIRVAVVDNNSNDGSAVKLVASVESMNWSSWAEIVPLDTNGGFAFGNNASIRSALESNNSVDYIMLLNPDTVPLPGAIKSLIDFMDAHPNAGIAGSQLKNSDGSVDNSAHTFPSPLGELVGTARLGVLSHFLYRYVVTPPSRDFAHSCDWISGASMIIRRQVLEEIGLMDENYFLYYEEVDFCRRSQQAGWECWYTPDSQVIHLEGASTGIRAKAKRRAAYWYDSRRRYFVKHYGVAGLVSADILWLIGHFLYLLRGILRIGSKNRESSNPKWFMFDLLWGDLKAILTGRVWGISHNGKQT